MKFPYEADLFAVSKFIPTEDGYSGYCINGAALLMDYINSKGGNAEVMQVELAFHPADPTYSGTILGFDGYVGRRKKAAPGMWNGHLVTIIHHGDKSYLADPTSTQVELPDVEDAVLPPQMFEVDEGWLAGKKTLFAWGGSVSYEYKHHEDTQLVRYKAFPKKRAYERASGFGKRRRAELLKEFIEWKP
jgi:hypothetical protein